MKSGAHAKKETAEAVSFSLAGYFALHGRSRLVLLVLDTLENEDDDQHRKTRKVSDRAGDDHQQATGDLTQQDLADAINTQVGAGTATFSGGKMVLKDVQKGIRKDFFDFLATGTGTASGATFQATLAQAWGQLQVLFEDDEIGAVYFLNPLDVADYLASANITLQTAFGMTYVENFLGLGTVILNSSVPKGKIYATAKDNIVLYYIPVNGADLGEVFDFTTDATGYIGIHEEPDYTNMTASATVINGMALFAERIDGVVVGSITPAVGG